MQVRAFGTDGSARRTHYFGTHLRYTRYVEELAELQAAVRRRHTEAWLRHGETGGAPIQIGDDVIDVVRLMRRLIGAEGL